MTHICVSKLTIIGSYNGLSELSWSVPSHYLNQWWNIVNLTLWNKFPWNLIRNSNIFIQENAIENVVWRMAVILCRPQCVNDSSDKVRVSPGLYLDQPITQVEALANWGPCLLSHWQSTSHHVRNITMTPHERHVVSNHRSFVCLFISLPASKKHQNPRYWPFVRGIHRVPVNSPQKGTVTRIKLPLDDVILDV